MTPNEKAIARDYICVNCRGGEHCKGVSNGGECQCDCEEIKEAQDERLCRECS